MSAKQFRSALWTVVLAVIAASLAFGQGYDFQTFSFPFPDSSPPSWNGVYAASINYQGVIAGTYYFRDPVTRGGYVLRGFKRYPNGYLEYPFQHPQDQSNLTSFSAINDLGEMAGTFWNLEPDPITGTLELHTRAFTYAKGIYSTIALGKDTVIEGMTNLRDLAGYYITPAGVQGFSMRGGVLNLLGPPGRNIMRCLPNDIGADGTVVGTYRYQGFIRGPNGNYLRIKVRDSDRTDAIAINNTAGKIVGTYWTSGQPARAFVYNYAVDLARVDSTVAAQDSGPEGAPLKLVDVETLDIPDFSGEVPYDINAHGVVVGQCSNSNNRVRAFIATPK